MSRKRVDPSEHDINGDIYLEAPLPSRSTLSQTTEDARREIGARVAEVKRRFTKEASATRRHVVPNRDGGWDVKKPRARHAIVHTTTQAEAERRAKQIVRDAGGGEVLIHRRNGSIRDSDTVAPQRDRNPPNDRKH